MTDLESWEFSRPVHLPTYPLTHQSKSKSISLSNLSWGSHSSKHIHYISSKPIWTLILLHLITLTSTDGDSSQPRNCVDSLVSLYHERVLGYSTYSYDWSLHRWTAYVINNVQLSYSSIPSSWIMNHVEGIIISNCEDGVMRDQGWGAWLLRMSNLTLTSHSYAWSDCRLSLSPDTIRCKVDQLETRTKKSKKKIKKISTTTQIFSGMLTMFKTSASTFNQPYSMWYHRECRTPKKKQDTLAIRWVITWGSWGLTKERRPETKAEAETSWVLIIFTYLTSL